MYVYKSICLSTVHTHGGIKPKGLFFDIPGITIGCDRSGWGWYEQKKIEKIEPSDVVKKSNGNTE